MVVTGPASPELRAPDDLAGKKVRVRRASSCFESLSALNEKLKRDRTPPVEPVLVPESLEHEDMMDMLNAGLQPLIVVDDWKARMWALVLPTV